MKVFMNVSEFFSEVKISTNLLSVAARTTRRDVFPPSSVVISCFRVVESDGSSHIFHQSNINLNTEH